eukprot:TRINITY_DN2145_c0_g1_i1.p1 TRINITY_DN2145_c0_g1~~TRINITY_DN2145_c0_g1_i1.p1  ORF type:complete len:2383 (-),score=640.18 TRINITY_DN2145_c0_g1_i1:42-7190(-)
MFNSPQNQEYQITNNNERVNDLLISSGLLKKNEVQEYKRKPSLKKIKKKLEDKRKEDQKLASNGMVTLSSVPSLSSFANRRFKKGEIFDKTQNSQDKDNILKIQNEILPVEIDSDEEDPGKEATIADLLDKFCDLDTRNILTRENMINQTISNIQLFKKEQFQYSTKFWKALKNPQLFKNWKEDLVGNKVLGAPPVRRNSFGDLYSAYKANEAYKRSLRMQQKINAGVDTSDLEILRSAETSQTFKSPEDAANWFFALLDFKDREGTSYHVGGLTDSQIIENVKKDLDGHCIEETKLTQHEINVLGLFNNMLEKLDLQKRKLITETSYLNSFQDLNDEMNQKAIETNAKLMFVKYLSNKLNVNYSQNIALSVELTKKQYERGELEAMLKIKESEVSFLNFKNNTLEDSLRTMEMSIESIQSHNRTLIREVMELRELNSDKINVLNALKRDRDGLNKLATESQKTIEILEKQNEDLRIVCKDLRIMQKEDDQTLRRLKSQLNSREKLLEEQEERLTRVGSVQSTVLSNDGKMDLSYENMSVSTASMNNSLLKPDYIPMEYDETNEPEEFGFVLQRGMVKSLRRSSVVAKSLEDSLWEDFAKKVEKEVQTRFSRYKNKLEREYYEKIDAEKKALRNINSLVSTEVKALSQWDNPVKLESYNSLNIDGENIRKGEWVRKDEFDLICRQIEHLTNEKRELVLMNDIENKQRNFELIERFKNEIQDLKDSNKETRQNLNSKLLEAQDELDNLRKNLRNMTKERDKLKIDIKYLDMQKHIVDKSRKESERKKSPNKRKSSKSHSLKDSKSKSTSKLPTLKTVLSSNHDNSASKSDGKSIHDGLIKKRVNSSSFVIGKTQSDVDNVMSSLSKMHSNIDLPEIVSTSTPVTPRRILSEDSSSDDDIQVENIEIQKFKLISSELPTKLKSSLIDSPALSSHSKFISKESAKMMDSGKLTRESLYGVNDDDTSDTEDEGEMMEHINYCDVEVQTDTIDRKTIELQTMFNFEMDFGVSALNENQLKGSQLDSEGSLEETQHQQNISILEKRYFLLENDFSVVNEEKDKLLQENQKMKSVLDRLEIDLNGIDLNFENIDEVKISTENRENLQITYLSLKEKYDDIVELHKEEMNSLKFEHSNVLKHQLNQQKDKLSMENSKEKTKLLNTINNLKDEKLSLKSGFLRLNKNSQAKIMKLTDRIRVLLDQTNKNFSQNERLKQQLLNVDLEIEDYVTEIHSKDNRIHQLMMQLELIRYDEIELGNKFLNEENFSKTGVEYINLTHLYEEVCIDRDRLNNTIASVRDSLNEERCRRIENKQKYEKDIDQLNNIKEELLQKNKYLSKKSYDLEMFNLQLQSDLSSLGEKKTLWNNYVEKMGQKKTVDIQVNIIKITKSRALQTIQTYKDSNQHFDFDNAGSTPSISGGNTNLLDSFSTTPSLNPQSMTRRSSVASSINNDGISRMNSDFSDQSQTLSMLLGSQIRINDSFEKVPQYLATLNVNPDSSVQRKINPIVEPEIGQTEWEKLREKEKKELELTKKEMNNCKRQALISQTQLQESNSRVQKLENELKTVSKKYKKMLSKTLEESALEAKKMLLMEQIGDLKEQIDKLSDKKTELSHQIDSLDGIALGSIKTDIMKGQEEMAKLKKRKFDLEKEIKRLELKKKEVKTKKVTNKTHSNAVHSDKFYTSNSIASGESTNRNTNSNYIYNSSSNTVNSMLLQHKQTPGTPGTPNTLGNMNNICRSNDFSTPNSKKISDKRLKNTLSSHASLISQNSTVSDEHFIGEKFIRVGSMVLTDSVLELIDQHQHKSSTGDTSSNQELNDSPFRYHIQTPTTLSNVPVLDTNSVPNDGVQDSIYKKAVHGVKLQPLNVTPNSMMKNQQQLQVPYRERSVVQKHTISTQMTDPVHDIPQMLQKLVNNLTTEDLIVKFDPNQDGSISILEVLLQLKQYFRLNQSERLIDSLTPRMNLKHMVSLEKFEDFANNGDNQQKLPLMYQIVGLKLMKNGAIQSLKYTEDVSRILIDEFEITILKCLNDQSLESFVMSENRIKNFSEFLLNYFLRNSGLRGRLEAYNYCISLQHHFNFFDLGKIICSLILGSIPPESYFDLIMLRKSCKSLHSQLQNKIRQEQSNLSLKSDHIPINEAGRISELILHNCWIDFSNDVLSLIQRDSYPSNSIHIDKFLWIILKFLPAEKTAINTFSELIFKKYVPTQHISFVEFEIILDEYFQNHVISSDFWTKTESFRVFNLLTQNNSFLLNQGGITLLLNRVHIYVVCKDIQQKPLIETVNINSVKVRILKHLNLYLSTIKNIIYRLKSPLKQEIEKNLNFCLLLIKKPLDSVYDVEQLLSAYCSTLTKIMTVQCSSLKLVPAPPISISGFDSQLKALEELILRFELFLN